MTTAAHLPPLPLHESAHGRPLHEVLREAGIVGCGGAGFPTWPKYEAPRPVLVINAQESEPGYFIDKWVHQEHPTALLQLVRHLHDWGVQKTVIAAKMPDRSWFSAMEEQAGVHTGQARVLDCTGRNRHDLLAQPESVLFAYTDDKYPYGMETALLLIIAQKKIPQGTRPTDHGFIVNNSETLLNMHQALTTGRPVTHKMVHVYGATPRHTFVEVPVGTRAADVLTDADVTLEEIEARGLVVAEGGPGWFPRIDPRTAVVGRRTNSLLVLDPAEVDLNKKDVLPGPNKPGYPRKDTHFAKTPVPLAVNEVVVPLVDNPALGAVRPAVPSAKPGDHVKAGQPIAHAAPDGISVVVHASLDGEVVAVSAAGIHIRAS
jgi:Na+-translocating ferredoxin:NAD+ oxidoreductase subunit C